MTVFASREETKRDRLGILANNRLEWCELTLATLRAGGIVVPLNVRLSPPELSYVVGNAGCSIIACDEQLAERYDAVAGEHDGVLRVGIGAAAGDVGLDELRDAGTPRPVRTGSEDPAIIPYTSGTTGRPKGATLTNANILASVSQWQNALGWTSESRFLLVAPLAFTGGIVSNFMSAYVVGAMLVVEEGFEPGRALQVLTETPITTSPSQAAAQTTYTHHSGCHARKWRQELGRDGSAMDRLARTVISRP